jgi:hypothetical protein
MGKDRNQLARRKKDKVFLSRNAAAAFWYRINYQWNSAIKRRIRH